MSQTNGDIDSQQFALLQAFRDRFRLMSDAELIGTRKRENETPGWTSSRALFLTALGEEFERRKLADPRRSAAPGSVDEEPGENAFSIVSPATKVVEQPQSYRPSQK